MNVDLTTRYLGLNLANPLVASAGPLTGDLQSLRSLEDAGIAAAVLPSLFEEQLQHMEQQVQALYEDQNNAFAESDSLFPDLADYDIDYNIGPRDYLRQIESAKQAVSIPIIGSLNGSSQGGWTQHAKAMEQAGLDALELNIYFVPTDPTVTAAEVEKRYVDLVASVSDAISIPLSVKIGAQFSSLPNFVAQLSEAGADGIVLFNRYLEPDIDLHTLQITPQLILSSRHELRLPLRWIGIIRDQLSLSLAATSGAHCGEDAVKLLLVGADAVMFTSALLKYGAEHVGAVLNDVRDWLVDNEYESVEQLKGSMSYDNYSNPGELERANYMKALVSYTANS